MARILRRSPRIQFVDDAAAAHVEADFSEQSTGSVVANLVLVKPGAKPSPRRIVARSCAQASDAAALIIAVSFDPEALTEDRTSIEPGQPVASPSAPTRSTDSERQPQPKPEVSQSPPPADAPGVEAQAAPISGERWTAPLRYRFGVHVAAQGVFGPAPGMLPGVGVYALFGIERDSAWSPAFGLGGMHVGRAGFEEEGGNAAFTLDAATLDVCLLRFGGDTFRLRACGSGLLGRLSVEGTETTNPAGLLNRPFAMAGGAAIASVELGRSLELIGRLAAGSTLVRDSFEFTPTIFHTAGPLTVFASVGVGIHSP